MKRGLGLALPVAATAIAFNGASGRASTPSRIVFAADRAPRVSGEIYRVSPNGHRVDLSRSPYQDTNPVVSSDGKRVAFISDRKGLAGVYEVGISGRGLVAVAPKVPGLKPHTDTPDLAWQPNGHRLAVGVPSTNRVAIVRPRREPISVHGALGYGLDPWSPDGRVLLVWTRGRLRAVTPQGRSLWTVPAARPSSAWSPQGLLAVTIRRAAAVYDEGGHLRFTLRFGPTLPVSNPVWSPDGRMLLLSSTYHDFHFQVRTSDGQLLLRKRIPHGGLSWADHDRLVLGGTGHCFCHTEYMNVHTGRLSPGSPGWLLTLSADQKLAIEMRRSGTSFSLTVGPPGGGARKSYAEVPGCWSDESWRAALDSVQFVGRTPSVVYASVCYEPFRNLYSIAPDGTGLHKIGAIKPYATEPLLSPDGSQVAYSWSKFTGDSCKGCGAEIRVANIDGTGTRALTSRGNCYFDYLPTWSPDGQTLLYTEASCYSTHFELFTVPATGGSPHDLGIAAASPAWGPSRIAFESDTGLWTANPDGSDPVLVAKKGGEPAWAADGRLAYLLSPATVVVGSTQVKLPFASISSLAWSPDGTRFVVTAHRKRAPTPDVYTVRTDGTDLIRLTKNYDARGVSWR